MFDVDCHYVSLNLFLFVNNHLFSLSYISNQLLQPETNHLDIFVLFQVFLTNPNNLYTIICFQETNVGLVPN